MTNAARHPAKTVLICEDDSSLRTLVRLAIGNGYTFVEAEDGDSALEQLERSDADLIVLDLMLPGRSGLEVLEEIRSRDRHRRTPIVVISAWDDSNAAAVAAGADRFVPKPFDPDELRATVTDLLESNGDHA